jgi:urate oxidase
MAETTERMLATEVSASWRYRAAAVDRAAVDWAGVDWANAHERATAALLTEFASTYRYSLQQTRYAIGERILAEVPETCEVRLALPNKHHFLVDPGPFGLGNENEVYYAADRPYGLIEGRCWPTTPGRRPRLDLSGRLQRQVLQHLRHQRRDRRAL